MQNNLGSGALALVGSGEYLPVMAGLEGTLLQAGLTRGKRNTFVQIPTAAGLEDDRSLARWRRLGEEQAERLGTTSSYIPLHTREDAFRPDLVEAIQDAALIYFSGGDPHHLALSLHNTPAWEAIEKSWRSGSSLGGCSAGAMAFGEEIISIRKSHAMAGLGLVPKLQVIPHYDKFLGWLPDRIASTVISAKEGTILLGIDEETALVRDDEESDWRVWGERKVHVLKGLPVKSYSHGEIISF
jgi:cyanophycinase